MVFYCRCFSFLLQGDSSEVEEEEVVKEDEEDECENRSQAVTTTTFYTAASDFNRFAKPSDVSNLVEKRRSNLRVFSLSELKDATENFCEASNVGKGAFGTVYKGVIKSLKHPFDDIQVAVKLASELLQGRNEWEAEVVLGVVEHPNLVKLIGYCAVDSEIENGKHLYLVYEYVINGCVRDHLSSKSKTPLSWDMRLQVAQDAARGLTYLHDQMDFQIVFKTFKSSNVLLDDQWNAVLSDLGMPRILGPDGIRVTHISNRIVGFTEYAAPESLATGQFTSASDVWCYGIFLYELITGRHPLQVITGSHGPYSIQPFNERKLLEWVKPYLGTKRFKQITDPRLEGNYLLKAQKLCIIANKCLSDNPESRPKMSEVLEMVNQCIRIPSQASGLAAPQAPQVTVESEKNNEDIRVKKPACLPWMHPLKLLKSCSKKGCCVPLH